jgi:hypothetical protein
MDRFWEEAGGVGPSVWFRGNGGNLEFLEGIYHFDSSQDKMKYKYLKMNENDESLHIMSKVDRICCM